MYVVCALFRLANSEISFIDCYGFTFVVITLRVIQNTFMAEYTHSHIAMVLVCGVVCVCAPVHAWYSVGFVTARTVGGIQQFEKQWNGGNELEITNLGTIRTRKDS